MEDSNLVLFASEPWSHIFLNLPRSVFCLLISSTDSHMESACLLVIFSSTIVVSVDGLKREARPLDAFETLELRNLRLLRGRRRRCRDEFQSSQPCYLRGSRITSIASVCRFEIVKKLNKIEVRDLPRAMIAKCPVSVGVHWKCACPFRAQGLLD